TFHCILFICAILLAGPLKAEPGSPPDDQPSAFGGELKKLRLIPMCSPEPARYRVWKVHNRNHFTIHFTWNVYQTDQSGSGVATADGEVSFTTTSVDGPNTTRIFVDGEEHDVQASQPEACQPPPPSIPQPPPHRPEKHVTICHRPPGNPENMHELVVG